MDRFKNRRRNYYINKAFQRGFILKFCGLVALGALISGCIVYAMSSSTVTTTFVNSRLTIKSTAEYILPAVLLGGVIVIFLTSIATAFIVLFTSHKIAGPLYRMEKDIDEVAAGNLAMRITLRTGDELKALAASFNVMIRSLKEKVEAAKGAASGLEEAAGKGDGQAVKEKIEKLKSELDKFTV